MITFIRNIFFDDDKKDLASIRQKTLEDIAEKTDWPLILFLPRQSKATKWNGKRFSPTILKFQFTYFNNHSYIRF